MALPYAGQDPFTAGAYVSGKGYWLTVQVPDDNDERDAASYAVGLEGITDRTNWIAWRMVNGLESNVAPYPAAIIWGGAHTFNNAVTFENDFRVKGEGRFDNWPRFQVARTAKRRAWRIANGTYDPDGANSGAPLRFHSWLDNGDTNAVPCLKTTATIVPGNKTLVELLELPGYATLTNVKVVCRGLTPANNAVPGVATFPTFQLVEWSAATAIVTLSSAAASGHSMANWESVLEATVTPTSTLTIDKNRHYGILIVHPVGNVGNPASCRVFDFETTLSLTTIPQ